ncbi:MAG: type IX secretion system membrane protein PorP/SprF [Bacteroidaceae bacterium]
MRKKETLEQLVDCKWIICSVVAFFLLVQNGNAQYDPSFAHYWMLKPQFNPATAGHQPVLNITAAYSAQLSGFENAPQTMYAGVDLPMFFINAKHGMGVQFLNDEIGLFSHKRFSLQYAYHFRLWGGTMSLGLQGDMLSETFDGSKLDVEDSNDPAFSSSSVSGSKIDAAFGLYYARPSWYAGLSAQHLTAPTILLGETNQLKIDPTFYFTAGYNIKLRSTFLTIHPSVLAKYDGAVYRVDVTGRLQYEHENQMLYGGASYSPTTSVTLFVGGKFQGVNLSYSYEAYTSALGIKSGNHELTVMYQVDLNINKKGRNKHKSVRLL